MTKRPNSPMAPIPKYSNQPMVQVPPTCILKGQASYAYFRSHSVLAMNAKLALSNLAWRYYVTKQPSLIKALYLTPTNFCIEINNITMIMSVKGEVNTKLSKKLTRSAIGTFLLLFNSTTFFTERIEHLTSNTSWKKWYLISF